MEKGKDCGLCNECSKCQKLTEDITEWKEVSLKERQKDYYFKAVYNCYSRCFTCDYHDRDYSSDIQLHFAIPDFFKNRDLLFIGEEADNKIKEFYQREDRYNKCGCVTHFALKSLVVCAPLKSI